MRPLTKGAGYDLQILTFNSWLLRTPLGFDVARHVDYRLSILPGQLAEVGADVVCLQEVWDPRFRAQIAARMLAHGYPYSAGAEPGPKGRIFPWQWPGRFFGSGLMILSKHPIVEGPWEHTFRHHTRTDERFVRKGALAVTIELSPGERICVANTQLGAVSYSRSKCAYERSHVWNRFRQTVALAKWLHRFEARAPLFLAADLNVHFCARLEYGGDGALARELEILLGERGKKFRLSDTFLELGAHKPEPQWTFHRNNPYVASGFFGHFPDEVSDYIFYRKAEGWRVESVRRVFVSEVLASFAPRHRPLSDHYGLVASFRRL